MAGKICVGILFGGRSAEHEVSLLSAKSVVEAINKNKYDIVLIGINKTGEWFLHDDLHESLLNAKDPKLISLKPASENVTVVARKNGTPLVSLSGKKLNRPIDVIFPVLHGPYGEDGTVQGLLKMANIPFVGASVLSSAVAMDKDVMKRLLKAADLPIARFLVFHQHERNSIQFDHIAKTLGMPFFIKPANLGSSIGISKVKHKDEFQEKLDHAFLYDRKILIEEYIPGREIECSVLGNEDPIASLPGELIPQHEFYSYEAKYIDENGASFEIPAKISAETCKQIQAMAVSAYKTLCCEGMGRVDMFLQENGNVVINELNTIPGFTQISMYPKMWAASGLPYPDLIDRLIELALERHQAELKLETNFALLK